MNARRAPERIGERHRADELGNLRADGRSTCSPASGLPGPESAKALPMPTNYCLGANDVERLAPPGPPFGEPYPEGAIEAPEPRPLRVVAEQGGCWRSARFSSASSVCLRSAALAAPQESEYEGHCAPASLGAIPSSSVTIEFWQTTGQLRERVCPFGAVPAELRARAQWRS